MERPRRPAMKSASVGYSKKSIVIVDPERRSRDRISGLISRLGYSPVAIQDAQALIVRGMRPLEFDLLLMVCSVSDHVSAMHAIEQMRLLVGRDVPMGLIGASRDLVRAFIVLHAGLGDDAIVSPPSDLHGIQYLVESLLKPRRIPSFGQACTSEACYAREES